MTHLGIVGTSGLIVQFAGFISVLLLYRTLKYGPIMNVVPYVLLFMGATLQFLAPDVSDPILENLVVLAVTAIVHIAVIYEMRRDAMTPLKGKE